MFLELYVVRLSRTSDDGSFIHGKWRGQQWIRGEALFPSFHEAKKVRSRVGGNVLPFNESRLFKSMKQEVQNAIEVVSQLDSQTMFDEAVTEEPVAEEPVAEEPVADDVPTTESTKFVFEDVSNDNTIDLVDED